MTRIIVLVSILLSLILSGIGWSGLSVNSLSGDVVERDPLHPCPTLRVQFDHGGPVPDSMRACPCPVQAEARNGEVAVHPPKELVDRASRGDRIGFALHEYSPALGGEKRKALKWVLAGGKVGELKHTIAPAAPLYRNIILTGVFPLLLGVLTAIVIRLFFRRKAVLGSD